MKGGPIAFQWRDEPTGLLGPGVSRAADPNKAEPYTLIVKQTTAKPIKVILMAESKELALHYAANRWPGSDVEVAA